MATQSDNKAAAQTGKGFGRWLLLGGAVVLVAAIIGLVIQVRRPTGKGAAGGAEAAAGESERGFWGFLSGSGSGATPVAGTAPRASDKPGQLRPAPQPTRAEVKDKVRAWSPQSVEMPQPRPGEEAPVRAHRLDTYDPTKPGPPPNPFIPPKEHLTEEDTRAGLDPPPPQ
jgi:hypothetical protein